MPKSVVVLFFTLLTTLSNSVFGDTALDGFWNLNRDYGVVCANGSHPSPKSQNEFFKKYGHQQMHLSALHAVWYLTLSHGELITVAEPLKDGDNPNEYSIRRPWLTVADIELSLKGELLQFTSVDTEFGMCPGGKYRVYFDYLRLNP